MEVVMCWMLWQDHWLLAQAPWVVEHHAELACVLLFSVLQ
jgi:hypothetical protein